MPLSVGFSVIVSTMKFSVRKNLTFHIMCLCHYVNNCHSFFLLKKQQTFRNWTETIYFLERNICLLHRGYTKSNRAAALYKFKCTSHLDVITFMRSDEKRKSIIHPQREPHPTPSYYSFHVKKIVHWTWKSCPESCMNNLWTERRRKNITRLFPRFDKFSVLTPRQLSSYKI